MKNYNQKMSFKIEDNKLKMEILIQDLIDLFHTHPNNFDGENNLCRIKPKKEQEFAEWLGEELQEPPDQESNIVNWYSMFIDSFDKMLQESSMLPFISELLEEDD